jgi:DNA-binding NarL/FixJ family response regulator
MVSTVNLGHTARHLGNLEEAKTRYLETLGLAQDLHNLMNAVEALMGLSSLVLADVPSETNKSSPMGFPQRSGREQVAALKQTARLCGLAAGLLESGGRQLVPIDQAEFEHIVAKARDRLDVQAFSAAWEEGRSMTLDQALDLANASYRPDNTETRQSGPDHLEQTYPDNLTEREIDVLRLIAGGKSNQQIASELVLSLRTVERHISNIYQKIGAIGRIARATATVYAHRHGLTG